MIIDSETYKTSKDNSYKTKIAKTQIVLASSLRKGGHHVSRLRHKDYGNSKRWNTYTISRDGIVYQHYDDKYHSDFLQFKEGDKRSISIVLENMGCLFETNDGKYINWLNEVCDEDRVIEKKWSGYHFWEKFTDIQLKNTVKLCRVLCEKYNIPKTCIEFNHYHKNIVKFKGIVFRSNYIENSSDVTPLFDIERFNEMLNNENI